jgi:hypothetical protein
MNAYFGLLKLSTICIVMISTPVVASEKITLTCVWTVYGHMAETFVIDFKSNNVLWVEEETNHKINELSDGFIKFSAVKSKMEGNGGGKIVDVMVDFKINRISGRFDAFSEKVATDRVGECVVGKLF